MSRLPPTVGCTSGTIGEPTDGAGEAALDEPLVSVVSVEEADESVVPSAGALAVG